MVALLQSLLGSLRDLMPIILVIAFFQLVVLQQPLPNFSSVIIGLILVVLGLTFFIFGLEMGLFPIGESMAHSLARKGSVFWLILFAFCLGFGTTIAEPALTAVAAEAARVVAEGGKIVASAESQASYALGLRFTVAFSVGFAEAQICLDKVMLKDQDSLYQSLIAKLELHQQAADTPEIRALEEAHSANPSDFSVSYQLALQYNQVSRDEEALTLLLEILRRDLNYDDGAVKKSMLDILSALGQENPITGTFRRKLYTLLY